MTTKTIFHNPDEARAAGYDDCKNYVITRVLNCDCQECAAAYRAGRHDWTVELQDIVDKLPPPKYL